MLSSSFTSSNISLYIPHPAPSSSGFHRLKVVASSSYTTTETRRRPRSRSCNNFNTQKMASAASSSSSSLYEVLGISMSASGHEIKAAYRRLARMCHPDVVAMNQKEMSATEFVKIHAAYSTLSDPDKRADYDRDLFRRKLQPVDFSSSLSSAAMASMSRFSGSYTGRNWETDQCW